MTIYLRHCMICGRFITASFWVCASCEEEHGLNVPFRQWPVWAKELKREHERGRRNERARLLAEIEFGDEDTLEQRLADAKHIAADAGLAYALANVGLLVDEGVAAEDLAADDSLWDE